MSNRNPLTLMTIPNEDAFDFLFKIVLIGDCGTGKTCVVQRFKNGTFIERHGNTIGVDFSMKTVIVEDKKVKVTFYYAGDNIFMFFYCNNFLCLTICIFVSNKNIYSYLFNVSGIYLIHNFSELSIH